MALVSLAEVNNALRLDIDVDPYGSGEDGGLLDDITAKVGQASNIILDYLKNPEGSDEWNEETAPERVKAATIIAVDCLLKNDENAHKILGGLQGNDLANPIVGILYRLRDPALA